jgi:hypothetical protein
MASFDGLKAQLFEPPWVAKLRSDLREDIAGFAYELKSSMDESKAIAVASNEGLQASVVNLSNSTQHSLTNITKVNQYSFCY